MGTRGSLLALTQTNWVAERLKRTAPAVTIETVVIKTKGDVLQDAPLAKVGGKGLFVKEIEDALLRDEVDIAVHSMKDVPMELPEGLEIGVMSEREDPRDVLISKDRVRLEDMPTGARIGTGSLRRGFQLLHFFPDIKLVSIRGNLDTRIRKIQKDGLDGIIVAAAGLKRLGWADRITQVMPMEIMLPAVGQGVLGIELRKDDETVLRTVSFLNHPRTSVEVSAERAFLKRLGGGCQLPVAAYGVKKESELTLRGLLGSLDGRELIKDEVIGSSDDAEVLGTSLAERILSRGGQAILDNVYRKGLFCGEQG
ncbi:MAG TPA: hydroxymethylbilane synthase [Syntrophales bacterium]|nr:hydroxymethylbilane synthase [Syntrophales bacterium]